MPGRTEILPVAGELSDLRNTKTGLVLHTCPNIKSLLSVSAASKSLPAALHNEAVQYLDALQVPYPVLRDLWVQLTPDYGVPFHQVLAGSSFVLESPKPREKSKELKDRLAKLQDLADQKAYAEIVKDITKHQHDEDHEYFSSYKDSLGFGLHVVLIMFTGYVFGYTIFRSQFPHTPALHAAGGVLGLIAGMLVETVLFIVRASIAEKNMQSLSQAKLNSKPVSDIPSEVMRVPDVQEEAMSFGARKRFGRIGQVKRD